MEKHYDEAIRVAVGKKIKELRKEKDFTQEAFAFLVGIDRTYISFIERGIWSPRLPLLYKIAHTLEVSPGVL